MRRPAAPARTTRVPRIADEHRQRSLEQIARNEARFRVVNEAVAETVGEVPRQRAVGFVCECGDAGCRRLVDLTPQEYVEVRAEPLEFLVVPGHEIPAAETVVRRVADRYLVVRKPDELGPVIADET